jgi:hypothetical protein
MIDCRFVCKDFNVLEADDLLVLKDIEIIPIDIEKSILQM